MKGIWHLDSESSNSEILNIEEDYFFREKPKGEFLFGYEGEYNYLSSNNSWIIPEIKFSFVINDYVNNSKKENTAVVSLNLPYQKKIKVLVKKGDSWNFEYDEKKYKFEICSLNQNNVIIVRLNTVNKFYDQLVKSGHSCEY